MATAKRLASYREERCAFQTCVRQAAAIYGQKLSSGDPVRQCVRLTQCQRDPAEQAPLVARSVTTATTDDISAEMMERGDDTARSTLRGPSAACTSILDRVCYDPPP